MKAFSITQEVPLLEESKNQLIQPVRPSWKERTFGRLNVGGVRSSIFLLVATALGPGCLTLPMAFKNSGLLFGTLFLFLAAIFSAIALYMLFQASKRTYSNSYAECVALVLGYKSAVAIQLIIVVYVFFVLVAYEMMIVQILNGMFMHFGVVGGLADRHSISSKIMAVIICTSIFPLCLKRDLSKLNYVATLGVASIIYVVLVIVIQCPGYIDRYWAKGHIDYTTFDWNFPASFTYAIFAYNCITVVFQVRAEMFNPTNKRMEKILTRAVLLEFFIYGSLSIFAYISLLDKIPGVILNRPALGGENSADIPMQVARFMMALVIYLGIPINISPCKQGIIILASGSLKQVAQKTSQQMDILFRISPKVNFWISFAIMYIGVFFVIVYPEILFVVKLISGYLACSMGLLFPTLLYCANLKEENNKKTTFKYWAILLGGIFFSSIGYFAASLNVYQMLGGVLPGVTAQGN